MRRAWLAVLVLFAANVVAVPTASAQRSGYVFLAPETRKMQDDDFSNPGFFAVDRGAELWSAVAGPDGKSCSTCHGSDAATLKSAAASYPRIDPRTGTLANLEQRINTCRTAHMRADPLPYESDDLIGLTTLVRHRARGAETAVDGIGAASHLERGRQFYFQRRGLFDLSCADCHDGNPDRRLRAEAVTEGHINGFPSYKLKWQAVGSTHRQFERCNSLARAEPFPLGSIEYLELELYLAVRGRGLAIETPAIRP